MARDRAGAAAAVEDAAAGAAGASVSRQPPTATETAGTGEVGWQEFDDVSELTDLGEPGEERTYAVHARRTPETLAALGLEADAAASAAAPDEAPAETPASSGRGRRQRPEAPQHPRWAGTRQGFSRRVRGGRGRDVGCRRRPGPWRASRSAKRPSRRSRPRRGGRRTAKTAPASEGVRAAAEAAGASAARGAQDQPAESHAQDHGGWRRRRRRRQSPAARGPRSRRRAPGRPAAARPRASPQHREGRRRVRGRHGARRGRGDLAAVPISSRERRVGRADRPAEPSDGKRRSRPAGPASSSARCRAPSGRSRRQPALVSSCPAASAASGWASADSGLTPVAAILVVDRRLCRWPLEERRPLPGAFGRVTRGGRQAAPRLAARPWCRQDRHQGSRDGARR